MCWSARCAIGRWPTSAAGMLAKIAAAPEAGRLAFDLPGRPGRTARRVTLAVRFCPVILRQPERGADRRDPPQVSLNLVEAREIDPPPGEEPIVWRLLTTHAAASLAEAAWIIDLYRYRWIVEQLFRTLKSQGLDLEDSFLSDGDALECLAATALIAAASVMQLVQGRGEAGSAAAGLARLRPGRNLRPGGAGPQVRRQDRRNRRTRTPDTASPGRPGASPGSGGWNGYAKERPPGPITFVRGLRRFHAIAEGFDLAAKNSPQPHLTAARIKCVPTLAQGERVPRSGRVRVCTPQFGQPRDGPTKAVRG